MTTTRIIASAPGKVILHGEHAVVFGKNAIAVSVGLRTTVTIEPQTDDRVILHAENFHQTFSWTLDELTGINYVVRNVENNVPLYDELEVRKLNSLLNKLNACDNHFALDTAKSFLLILLNVSNVFNDSKPIALTASIVSQLPVGAGMGSSASFSVSLTAGLLQAFNVPNLTKELVCRWSFECEKLFHGRPSGIDNSICTYGGAILFKNGHIVEALQQLDRIDKIVLVYTNVPRNTKQLVAKTTSRRVQFPAVIDSIFDSIDQISLMRWDQIKNGTGDYEATRTLIEINQNLLRALGASHSTIDDIVRIAEKFELAAKLTGAGAGGTVFVQLKPGTQNETLDSLLDTLKTKGYQSWTIKSGSDGVCLEECKIQQERKRIF